MPHVPPLDASAVSELSDVLERTRAAMGFVPNSILTMAHRPQLAVAFSALAGVVFGADLRDILPHKTDLPEPGEKSDNLPSDLIQLVAYAASLTAGCRYCQAHTAHGAQHLGVSSDKLSALASYDASAAFDARERAALALAFAAAAVPNEASELHFQRLREHFSERQIVQLVAVIALFGFLNRWNDTLATALEDAPRAFAVTTLGPDGWQSGKHH